jgi:hypothetical protein
MKANRTGSGTPDDFEPLEIFLPYPCIVLETVLKS